MHSFPRPRLTQMVCGAKKATGSGMISMSMCNKKMLQLMEHAVDG